MRFSYTRYHSLVIGICVATLTAVVIWPALKGPLILDDFSNLAPLRGNGDVNYYDITFGNNSGPLGRSIAMLTFVLNHWLSGEIVPFELKLTNLIIHLFNGLLLYGLTLSLLQRVYPNNAKTTLAIIVVACWLLNPINAGTVPYAIQRMALLAALFVFLGCLSYTRARICLTTHPKTAKVFFLITLLCWPLATLCKENGVLLPLFILVLEVCFFDTLWRGWGRLSWTQKLVLSIAFCVLVGLFLILLNSIGLMDYSGRNFSLAERLYTQPRVLLDYARRILLPSGVDIGLYHDDFETSKSLWNTPTLLSSLVLLFTLVVALVVLNRNRNRYLVSGVLLFFSGHLVESSVFPLEMYFDHRNYLPSAGLWLSLVLIIDRFTEGWTIRKFLPIAIILYLTILGYISYEKSKVWASQEAIIINTYRNHSSSVRANLDMSALLTQRGDLRGSLLVNSQISSLDPLQMFRAKIQRFYIYCELGSHIPDSEYEDLRNSVSLYRSFEVSTALGYFLESYKTRDCDFIDIKRVTEGLGIWVDKEIERKRLSAENTWPIEYYIVELLFAAGYHEDALSRLVNSADAGNIKARYYLQEIEKGK